MSELLKNKQVEKALNLLGIEDPENHEVYRTLSEAYKKLQHLFIEDTPGNDPCGVFVDTIMMHCKYESENGPRRVKFFLSKEAHLSQIFLHIIFMKSGHMEHRSDISLNVYTPISLIKFANLLINRLE